MIPNEQWWLCSTFSWMFLNYSFLGQEFGGGLSWLEGEVGRIQRNGGNLRIPDHGVWDGCKYGCLVSGVIRHIQQSIWSHLSHLSPDLESLIHL